MSESTHAESTFTSRANFVDFYHPPTRKTILSLEVNDANIVRGERDPERRAQLAGQSLVRFAMSPSGQTLATLHDESSVKVGPGSSSMTRSHVFRLRSKSKTNS